MKSTIPLYKTSKPWNIYHNTTKNNSLMWLKIYPSSVDNGGSLGEVLAIEAQRPKFKSPKST